MAGFEPVIRLASGSSLWTARARLTASVVAVPPASLVRVACALPWFPNPITLSLIFSNPSINPDSPSASRLFLRYVSLSRDPAPQQIAHHIRKAFAGPKRLLFHRFEQFCRHPHPKHWRGAAHPAQVHWPLAGAARFLGHAGSAK